MAGSMNRRSGAPAFVLLLICTFFAAIVPTAEATPLADASADADMVCANTTAGYVDKTGSANDGTINDVTLAKSSVPDPSALYIGFDAPFFAVFFDIGTGGTGGGRVNWKYWDGQSFVPLTKKADDTNQFASTGPHSITFDPPANWAKYTVNGNCPGERYYLKLTTEVVYTVAPQATQISGSTYNLRVLVKSETGSMLTGLTQTAFTVAAANDLAVHGFREVGSGLYELSLRADAPDTNYDISVAADGYVTSGVKATGVLASGPITDLTSTPFTLVTAFKVTGVTTEASTTLQAVTVSTGDNHGIVCTPFGGAYYCPVPLAHTALGVEVLANGYVTHSGKSFTADRTAASDPPRTVSVTGVLFALRVAIAGENSLSGVAWEKKVGTGDYGGVTPEAKVGTTAYFAIPSSEQDVTIRASKQGRSGTTGDPISASPTAQIVKTIAFANVAVTPAPTPTIAPPLTAPEDVVFEGVQEGVLSGAHVVVTWTPVVGAKDYVLYANDGDAFELESAVEVATAVTPPLEVNLPEGRKTYTLVARDAKDEVSAATPQAITVGDGIDDQLAVPYQLTMPPTWWFAAGAGGLVLLFILWIISPSVVGLRPRPGTTPKHGFAWRMRHCKACSKALPRSHRLFRVLHACVVVGTIPPQPVGNDVDSHR